MLLSSNSMRIAHFRSRIEVNSRDEERNHFSRRTVNLGEQSLWLPGGVSATTQKLRLFAECPMMKRKETRPTFVVNGCGILTVCSLPWQTVVKSETESQSVIWLYPLEQKEVYLPQLNLKINDSRKQIVWRAINSPAKNNTDSYIRL